MRVSFLSVTLKVSFQAGLGSRSRESGVGGFLGVRSRESENLGSRSRESEILKICLDEGVGSRESEDFLGERVGSRESEKLGSRSRESESENRSTDSQALGLTSTHNMLHA